MLLSPEIEGGGRGFDVAVPFATPCRPCAGHVLSAAVIAQSALQLLFVFFHATAGIEL
ncbi:TPA: hypothetical protein J1W16_004908 [Escherichia coli]|nr:hypothetical protein [Escherichia coli]